MTKTVQTDAHGRLNLGKRYASSTFILEEIDREELVLKRAAVIPEKELWLLKNPEALKSVQKGLKEAKEGKLHRVDPKEFED